MTQLGVSVVSRVVSWKQKKESRHLTSSVCIVSISVCIVSITSIRGGS